MAKVIVLGGCGAVGSVAVKTLAAQDVFEKIIIGDINRQRADSIISENPHNNISFLKVNAEDSQSIQSAISGCDLVVNCIGPFYKTVKTILEQVIAARINYVDVCDDVDVTLEIFELHEKAKNTGITALIGMGSSPGATNLLAKFAADHLLDSTEAIDIFHAHGGEPVEGEGVIGHRFHCISIDIPMFLDGELRYVKFFEEDGRALRRTFDFPVLGNDINVYPYPHPEQVTIPKYIPLKQVTNRGTVLPDEYYTLTKDVCKAGLANRDPLDLDGRPVIPYDFAMAYIIRERERILKETNFGRQRGCCSVVATGKKDGNYQEYRFHMASQSEALGEGTGIPAAIGGLLMQQGKITQKGVLPPEGCVNPVDFIDLITIVMDLDKKDKESHDEFGGVIVQKIDDQGNMETIDI
ncbi:MAG: saccharopine dehydrogenase [Desulfobacterales bacterium]|nr:saccharopine dehydrogenase [Desulfobacterales bacterium]